MLDLYRSTPCGRLLFCYTFTIAYLQTGYNYILKVLSCFVMNYFLKLCLFLRRESRIFLRIRRDSGVISRSSSTSIKSKACSRLKILGGVSFRASSAEEERVLVRCLVLHTFNSISSGFPLCPITIPE